MTPEEKKALVDKLVGELVEDLKPEVTRIEASVATTMNHYGDYGSLLSTLGKGHASNTQLFALALIRAGASRQGVADGLRHFCGIEV